MPMCQKLGTQNNGPVLSNLIRTKLLFHSHLRARAQACVLVAGGSWSSWSGASAELAALRALRPCCRGVAEASNGALEELELKGGGWVGRGVGVWERGGIGELGGKLGRVNGLPGLFQFKRSNLGGGGQGWGGGERVKLG